MVLTARTHTTLFASLATATPSPNAKTLIRLPLSVVPHYEQRCEITGAIVPAINKPLFRTNLWTSDEHERFLHGLEMFPNGPWKDVAAVVGTKTTRQTMTHAQKYRQKIERRMAPKAKGSAKKSRCSAHRKSSTSLARDFGDMMGANGSFTSALASVSGAVQEHAVASPTDVYSGEFDVSFLDQELDVLLNSLELPMPTSQERMLTSTYADELGVFSF